MLRFTILLFAATLAACAGPGSKESLATRRAISDTAIAQIGVPYRYGGNDRDGFDCSGLVQYVYAQSGVELPRSTAEMMKIGARIAYSNARVGDLLFYTFRDRKHPSMHVAIYLGDDWMVHAPSSGGQVTKIRTDEKPWPKRYVAAVRILP
jgi:cell wall-associated NlpC family hydrolase